MNTTPESISWDDSTVDLIAPVEQTFHVLLLPEDRARLTYTEILKLPKRFEGQEKEVAEKTTHVAQAQCDAIAAEKAEFTGRVTSAFDAAAHTVTISMVTEGLAVDAYYAVISECATCLVPRQPLDVAIGRTALAFMAVSAGALGQMFASVASAAQEKQQLSKGEA